MNLHTFHIEVKGFVLECQLMIQKRFNIPLVQPLFTTNIDLTVFVHINQICLIMLLCLLAFRKSCSMRHEDTRMGAHR
jgi:hypothetical protein